jgi:hypothetical protein
MIAITITVLWLLGLSSNKIGVKKVILLITIIDFTHTWVQLLKQARYNYHQHRQQNVENNNNEQAYSFRWLMNKFYNNLHYRKNKEVVIRSKDHRSDFIDTEYHLFWRVSPFEVFATQFENLIINPVGKFGKILSTLIEDVLSSTSWSLILPISLLLPVILLVLVIGTCVVLSFITSRSIKLNLLQLVQFEFGTNNQTIRYQSGAKLVNKKTMCCNKSTQTKQEKRIKRRIMSMCDE